MDYQVGPKLFYYNPQMKNQLIQIKYGIYWMVVVNGNPFAAVSQGPS